MLKFPNLMVYYMLFFPITNSVLTNVAKVH